MKAVILAGGKGTRMQGVSQEIPKALLPIDGTPLCDIQLKALVQHGFTSVHYVLYHLGEQIEEYIGDGTRYGIDVSYVYEDQPSGTGGAMSYAQDYVGEDAFLLLYSDILFDMDLSNLVTAHKENEGVATVVIHESSHPEDSSNVLYDETGLIKSIGRPAHGHPITGMTKTSIHMLDAEIFNHAYTRVYSFEDDVLADLVEKQQVYAYLTEELVSDVGTPKRYYGHGGSYE